MVELLSGTDHGFRTTEGKHTDSNTILRIAESGSTLVAKVFRGTREITSECPASAFKWTRTSGNTSADTTWNDGHVDMKSIPFTDTDIANGVKYNCTYTETQGSYGTVSVNNALTASHTQSTADANHTFSITNGTLKVDIPNNAGNGTDYVLNGNTLQVNNGFSGSITAMYEFTESNVRDIDFEYDHNGLRTRKTVTENGVSTVYDYTLHGKLITCMTKRVGNTVSDTLYFFYDAQSKPAFVKWNNAMYRYVHNLQGDIAGILDANGNLVVEYKYDAWGKPLSTTGTLKTTLGALNPFRYRGYIYDDETRMYWLENRYYYLELHRFISTDALIGTIGRVVGHNLYTYCRNAPITMGDSNGFDPRLFYFYGKDQEEHATSNMKDLKKEYEVQGYLIASPEDFSNAWSNMYSIVGEDDIDTVVINLHGNPDAVEHMDHESLDYSKSIDTVILLVCNAGHLSTGKTNVAQKILLASKGNISRLVAADGTHFRGTFWHPFRGIQVKGDGVWKSYSNWKGNKSKGFTLYTRGAVSGYSIASIGKKFKSVRKLLKEVGC